jgi:hypothetical protein
MAAAVPYLIGASTLISIGAAGEEGEAIQAAKEFQAKTSYAAGTRKARETKRQGDILESGARAIMAAGGGSASDPGAIETTGKIGAETDYNALAAMYEGKTGADIARYEGRVAKQAAKRRQISTLLSGGSQAFLSYGGD